jgi:hypothetical protein
MNKYNKYLFTPVVAVLALPDVGSFVFHPIILC